MCVSICISLKLVRRTRSGTIQCLTIKQLMEKIIQNEKVEVDDDDDDYLRLYSDWTSSSMFL